MCVFFILQLVAALAQGVVLAGFFFINHVVCEAFFQIPGYGDQRPNLLSTYYGW